jgi:hypothetical protein
MAITKASSFTPEPNPDKASAAPIQNVEPAKSTNQTMPSRPPSNTGLATDELRNRGREAGRTMSLAFQAGVEEGLMDGMTHVLNTVIPNLDREWANIIDITATEIRNNSQLKGADIRSLGSAD